VFFGAVEVIKAGIFGTINCKMGLSFYFLFINATPWPFIFTDFLFHEFQMSQWDWSGAKIVESGEGF
jgi:hypothetical protein